jgi:hypothetical protein
MKTTLLVASLLFAGISNAQAYKDDPTEQFDTASNYTNQSTISWVIVDNVQKACEAESRKRGYNGFGFGVLACSFYKGDQCTIITGKKTTMHSLGHEVRHCFQADWHK